MLNGVTALDRAKAPVVELAKAPIVFGIFGKIHYLADGNKIVVVH